MKSLLSATALAAALVFLAALSAAPSLAKDHRIGAEFRGDRVGPMLERALERSGAKATGAAALTVAHGSDSPAALARAVRSVGATVDAASGNLVQARLTADQVRRLAEHPDVAYLRLPHRAAATEAKSEALSDIGVSALKSLGHRGAGVRVAVLDIGFDGYTASQGNELPANVQTKNFNGEGFATTPHGTAAAEIIHDIAPEAEITLVSFLTDVEFMAAVDWLMAQRPRFDVVSASIGFVNVGPPDGRSAITRSANRLLEEGGILYVNSAGNHQQRYYSARFEDADDNGWHEFAAGDERLEVELNGQELVELRLNWDDWGDDPEQPASSSNYDLFLWCPGEDTGDPAAACLSSAVAQDGEPFDQPLERIEEESLQGGTYRLGIRRSGTSARHRMRLSFDGPGVADFEYRTQHTTLNQPADGESVLAVGAFHYSDPADDYRPAVAASDPGFSIEDWQAELPPQPYSSLGPTWDGRHKPDISGPDCVTTNTYGLSGFCGTSAATPHVAGAAALLKSQEPARSGAALKRLLTATAEDVKPLGADDAHGAGRVNLTAAVEKPGISTRSGLWNNAKQFGHGFFIEAIGDTMVVLWYVYDRRGEPIWLMSSGTMESDARYEGRVLRFDGPNKIASPLSGHFDAAGTTRTHEDIGSLAIQFTGEATANVTIDLSGDNRVAPAEYFVEVSQFLVSPAASSSGLPYASPYSGLWHLPSQNGHGFIINRQGNLRSPNAQHFPTDKLVVAWFGYRTGGLPQWLLGSGTVNGAETFEKAGTSIGLRYFQQFEGPTLDGSQPLHEAFDRRGLTVSDFRSGSFAIDFRTRARGELRFHDGEQVSETLLLERMDF